MNKINLKSQNLTELTEENLINLCHLKNFKLNELENLNLCNNNLNDINFITKDTFFINLKELYINYNPIRDISNIKYLPNLTYLNISDLHLKDEKETVEILKNMKNLKEISIYKTFKNYTEKEIKKELFNIKPNLIYI